MRQLLYLFVFSQRGREERQGFIGSLRRGSISLLMPAAQQQPAKARTGERCGGQSDGESPENGAAQVGVILRGRQHGRRMRREHAMHHGESGEDRKADKNGRPAATPGGFSDNRHQQHQADFKKKPASPPAC